LHRLVFNAKAWNLIPIPTTPISPGKLYSSFNALLKYCLLYETSLEDGRNKQLLHYQFIDSMLHKPMLAQHCHLFVYMPIISTGLTLKDKGLLPLSSWSQHNVCHGETVSLSTYRDNVRLEDKWQEPRKCFGMEGAFDVGL
jgi:hypothetical protein